MWMIYADVYGGTHGLQIGTRKDTTICKVHR
jgi:hypothetical protein